MERPRALARQEPLRRGQGLMSSSQSSPECFRLTRGWASLGPRALTSRSSHGVDDVVGLSSTVVGDGRSLDDVRAAVRGRDAVISVVGPSGRGQTSVVSDVSSTVAAAMQAEGVRRLVVVSANGLVATHPPIAASIVRWVFRRVYADLAVMERVVRSSGLDWTIVRPTQLTNGIRR